MSTNYIKLFNDYKFKLNLLLFFARLKSVTYNDNDSEYIPDLL